MRKALIAAYNHGAMYGKHEPTKSAQDVADWFYNDAPVKRRWFINGWKVANAPHTPETVIKARKILAEA